MTKSSTVAIAFALALGSLGSGFLAAPAAADHEICKMIGDSDTVCKPPHTPTIEPCTEGLGVVVDGSPVCVPRPSLPCEPADCTGWLDETVAENVDYLCESGDPSCS